jgi:hypothetical protein
MKTTDEQEGRNLPAPFFEKLSKPKGRVWAIITSVFAICLALSFITAANYTEIAKAKVLTHVITEHSAALILDSHGNLESVNMTIDFTIVNPSGKPVRAWILSYKSWVRDLPMEMGLDDSRWRVDGTLISNGTEMSFFPVFVATYSFDSPKILISPESNITITRHITLDYSNYPDIMSSVASIYNQTQNLEEKLEWVHYTSAILFIDETNLDSLTSNADLIRRFDGYDITPGVGGAGP